MLADWDDLGCMSQLTNQSLALQFGTGSRKNRSCGVRATSGRGRSGPPVAVDFTVCFRGKL